MYKKYTVLLVGHGSREKGFQAAMWKVAKALEKSARYDCVACAYLEVTSPSIFKGIERLVRKGAAEIRVLPYFLLTGQHVKRHIPQIVAEARKKFKSRVKIILCPYLGFDSKIVDVVKKRLKVSEHR